MRIHVTNPERSAFEFSQIESEFVILEKIAAQGKSTLEIGSLYGGSGKRLAEAMPAGSRMVCIDLGMEKLKPAWTTLPALLWRLDSVPDRDVHLILGDSTTPNVIAEATKLGPYDLVFIDAGHSYENALSDWTHYGPLGKVVAFHDLGSVAAVRTLFDKIKVDYRHEEHVHGTAAGIGVIWR